MSSGGERGHQDGLTPLIQSAKNGHAGVVRMLIDAKAQVGACDKARLGQRESELSRQ